MSSGAGATVSVAAWQTGKCKANRLETVFLARFGHVRGRGRTGSRPGAILKRELAIACCSVARRDRKRGARSGSFYRDRFALGAAAVARQQLFNVPDDEVRLLVGR